MLSPKKEESGDATLSPVVSTSFAQASEVVDNLDHFQRRLGNRQIQLIAIGGSIGTGLFITIGNGLARGGPGSMLLGTILYCGLIALVNNCMAEMTVLMPVSGGFIRMAGKWVDDALGFMVGWNFFLYQALVIPFEITALSVVLSYWSDNIPPVAICMACIVAYGVLNILAVGAYGESEFWLSSGKVILIFILFGFTFFTMIGVNPDGDSYGFRHWGEGAFAEYRSTGDLGRFEGFFASIWAAVFIVVGPEYLSTAAAETKRPRVYLKNAFKAVYWRFGLFFIGSALCVGIVLPHNDPTLAAFASGAEGSGTTSASPYVMCLTYIFFYRACKAQNLDRRSFPYYGWFQPYGAWVGLIGITLVMLFYGYSSFSPWSVGTFFSYYAMVIVGIVTYTFWKLFKRTKVISACEADLVWEKPAVDAYEATCEEEVTTFWGEILDMFGWRKLRTRKADA
ncbi:hypothetical protein ACHAPT_011960 [Fusarium lateritium]